MCYIHIPQAGCYGGLLAYERDNIEDDLGILKLDLQH